MNFNLERPSIIILYRSMASGSFGLWTSCDLNYVLSR